MEVRVIREQDPRHIMLIGRMWQREDFDYIEEEIDRKQLKLILDLSRLTFVNSHGLGLLIKLHAQMDNHGGTLLLLSPQDEIREVINTIGLAEVFNVVDSDEC